MTNNTPLLPYTINTALVSAGARSSERRRQRARDGDELRASPRAPANIAVVQRPLSPVRVTTTVPCRSRSATVVNYDTSIVRAERAQRAVRLRRATPSTPTPLLRRSGTSASAAGYTREEVDRTYRIVEKTTEDIGRVSVDLTGLAWLTVRGVFEHVASAADRRWTGSRAARHRRTAVAAAVRHLRSRPGSLLDASSWSRRCRSSRSTRRRAFGRQEYPGTNFGLRNNDNHVYSLGVRLRRRPTRSRWASPTATRSTRRSRRRGPPIRCRRTRLRSSTIRRSSSTTRAATGPTTAPTSVRTFDASIDLLKLLPRTDIKVAYDYSRAESTYTYGLAPNTVDRDAGAAPAGDQRAAARDRRRPLLPDPPHLAVGLVYWFDKYRVDDFALGPVQQPGAAGQFGIAHADDAGLLLPAVYGQHVLGTHYVSLVGTEARCFRGSSEAPNLRPGERPTPSAPLVRAASSSASRKIPAVTGKFPRARLAAIRRRSAKTFGKTASIVLGIPLALAIGRMSCHVVAGTRGRQPQAADAARASAARRARRPAQRRQERRLRPADRTLRRRFRTIRARRSPSPRAARWSAPKSATSSTRRASTRSTAPISEDERITRDAARRAVGAELVVQVADARNLRRALMLTSQLARLRQADGPRAQHDRRGARARHRRSTRRRSSATLGIPVIEMVALEGRGSAELRDALRARPGHMCRRSPHASDRAAWADDLTERVRARQHAVAGSRPGVARPRGAPAADRPADPRRSCSTRSYLFVGVFGAQTLVGAARGRPVRPRTSTRRRPGWPSATFRSRSSAISWSASTA